MTRRLSRDQAVEKLQAIQESNLPVLFSLSVRSWPVIAAAKGHGLISELHYGSIAIIGRSGSMRLNLDEKYEYQLSGHYQLNAAQKSQLPEDMYFRRLNRVRAVLVKALHWEASLIFAVGGGSRKRH